MNSKVATTDTYLRFPWFNRS